MGGWRPGLGVAGDGDGDGAGERSWALRALLALLVLGWACSVTAELPVRRLSPHPSTRWQLLPASHLAPHTSLLTPRSILHLLLQGDRHG